MKAKKLFLAMCLLMAMPIVFNSCQDEDFLEPVDSKSNSLKSATIINGIEYCGVITTVDFLAGQHIEAGTVTVGNDATNLYVTYNMENGWQLKQTHLYVGDCALIPVTKSGNTQNGQFPYSSGHTPFVTTYIYTIPLANLPDCMCVAAHAEVVKVVNGEVVQEETAWGKGDDIGGKSWAMKFEYCKQKCTEEPPVEDTCYGDDKTAMTRGLDYTSANWFMYTSYGAGDVEICTGRDLTVIGKATFSEIVGGNVTITMTLNDGWSLIDANQTVKIQGYEIEPTEKPEPGHFAHKGTELTVTVPAAAYYGIHLDVHEKIPCD